LALFRTLAGPRRQRSRRFEFNPLCRRRSRGSKSGRQTPVAFGLGQLARKIFTDSAQRVDHRPHHVAEIQEQQFMCDARRAHPDLVADSAYHSSGSSLHRFSRSNSPIGRSGVKAGLIEFLCRRLCHLVGKARFDIAPSVCPAADNTERFQQVFMRGRGGADFWPTPDGRTILYRSCDRRCALPCSPIPLYSQS
jgi:hypothetical protein